MSNAVLSSYISLFNFQPVFLIFIADYWTENQSKEIILRRFITTKNILDIGNEWRNRMKFRFLYISLLQNFPYNILDFDNCCPKKNQAKHYSILKNFITIKHIGVSGNKVINMATSIFFVYDLNFNFTSLFLMVVIR